MSKGRGVPFSEMWYNKMANTAIAGTEKTFDKFVENFNSTFFLFDTKATACFELTKLAQKSFKHPDGIINDRFQKYSISPTFRTSLPEQGLPMRSPSLISSCLGWTNNSPP